jgi:hypothetical protein
MHAHCDWSQDVSVRKGALLAISGVLDHCDEDAIGKLGGLLLRFKSRILEMTEDVDANVAATALDLMTLLLR